MEKLNLDLNDPTPYPTSTPATDQTAPNYQARPVFSPATATPSMKKTPKILTIVLVVVALVGGTLTGRGAFMLQGKSSGLVSTSGEPIQQVAGDTVNAGDVFGVPDEKTFKDSAEGYLEKGGLEGDEGSHKLIRAGGDSQTVYLTSSVTDLDKFDGMTVKVWGETFKAQKAGWLMDVGRVQIVETQGEKPTEE